MFLHTDPQAQLDLHRQRAAELAKQAADYRLARLASSAGGRARWWHRKERGARPARVSVAA